jgi:hypothetical protein
MKKMMFLMLTLLIWSTASMNAQVTIGSDKNPHSGAVLDLQSDNLGLKLPNVALDADLTKFVLPLTAPSTKEEAKGMYVYNTNTTIGEGVYVWDGYQWILVKASAGEKPVTEIRISSESGYATVKTFETLQLIANVIPDDATDQTIVWSAISGGGYAIVSATGAIGGRRPGLVTVTATAKNGASKSFIVRVLADTLTPTLMKIGTRFYKTADCGGNLWMLENSMEGVSNYQENQYPFSHATGYYYTWDSANTSNPDATPCPGEWHLPSLSEAEALVAWLNTDEGGAGWQYFTGPNCYYGNYSATGTFSESVPAWWWTTASETSTIKYGIRLYSPFAWNLMTLNKNNSRGVRCVHD